MTPYQQIKFWVTLSFPDLTDGSTVMKHMVFGVVTAIDLLNFVTAREKRERSVSECTDEQWEVPAIAHP